MLCHTLSQSLSLPLYAIDKLQWQPGWTPADPSQVRHQHNEIIAGDRWIIDGWGTEDMLKARFERADRIILVDHPLWLHYWWATKRQLKSLFGLYRDGPEGCPMLPMTWPFIKMIWSIHHHAMPQLKDLISTLGESRRIIHIRSPRDLGHFYRELETVHTDMQGANRA